MSNTTKVYRVVRQEITSKKYLGGMIKVTELSKEDAIGHEIRIVTDIPVDTVWLNGKLLAKSKEIKE